ncbi:heme exporter protein CcmD [Thermomonas flagellata]|uniref:heme exporter protein CcmD n=1 Tax=Thermomonas flagellata TaxID=2888524 RepID=UPI001F0474DC|nr:heme exporter protein CcmD [Thermomonas flagellata]
MSYREYVLAAYAVFAIFLLWDWLIPRLQLRAALRATRRRLARQGTRAAPTDLQR